MDNTFFSGLSADVVGYVGAALISVVVLTALILGAVVGYRLYHRFTWMSSGGKGDNYYGSDEHYEKWKKAGRPL